MNGVTITPLKRIRTGKGDVLHALKCTDAGYAGFGEAYFSEVYSGQRKGWKRHNRMGLNLVVVVGRIRFYIHDDRPGSPTAGQTMQLTLSPDDDYRRLTVQPGLWVAFEGMAPQTSLLMDIIPEPHDPDEADRREIDSITI